MSFRHTARAPLQMKFARSTLSFNNLATQWAKFTIKGWQQAAGGYAAEGTVMRL